MDSYREAWQRQVLRLHERYLAEVVEACGLCPWAGPARRLGRTRTAVVLETGDEAVAATMQMLCTWEPVEEVEIGFLVYPWLPMRRRDFDHFVAGLRVLDASRRPVGECPFALAAFHPEAKADIEDPERLVPFLRRTPDPCIQLVRMSSLRRVRRGTPQGTQFVDVAALTLLSTGESTVPLAEQIARANLDTVRRMGVDAFGTRIEDILRDRDATYAALRATSGTEGMPSQVSRA